MRLRAQTAKGCQHRIQAKQLSRAIGNESCVSLPMEQERGTALSTTSVGTANDSPTPARAEAQAA